MSIAADHARNADVLDDAADYIEGHGWWDGAKTLAGRERATCIVLVTSRISAGDAAWAALDTLARRLVPKRSDQVGALIAWNDAPGRTAQEVIDALRGAAKSERTRADAIDANAPP